MSQLTGLTEPALIQFTMANEIAHIVLDREEKYSDRATALAESQQEEDHADKLAESWGFVMPKSVKNNIAQPGATSMMSLYLEPTMLSNSRVLRLR